MANYWLDFAGNIRRVEGEQSIIATTTERCSEHELVAILDTLNTKFASHDGLKLDIVGRISNALMRSLLRGQGAIWTVTPNPDLNDRSPADAIADGDGELVLAVIEKAATKPS